ncbi:MAG: hypothetical protein JSS97_01535 [Actinobacteria bacterium]|nr:hypothetical protein [Actinomycetota bacterium]
MSTAGPSSFSWRSRLGLMCLLLALAALIFATAGTSAKAQDAPLPPAGSTEPAVALEGGCSTEMMCMWSGSGYSGTFYYGYCGAPENYEFGLGFEANSVKDHCGRSVRFGWREGGSTNWKFCINGSEERGSPGRFNEEKMVSNC